MGGNIILRTYIAGILSENVEWIELYQDRVQDQASVDTFMNFLVP